MILTEIISGILSGLAYALISSVFVIFLSMTFKYFTNETFPWFVSTAIGLGIVGISGGLLAILDEPTPLSITRILVASLVLVWATNQGDKLATLLPKKKIHFGMISRHNYLALKVPDERDIIDIPGKPRVGMAVKKELAGHRHYSTFSQYSKSDLQACLARFEKNIRNSFEDPDNVRWTDENAMLTVRKD